MTPVSTKIVGKQISCVQTGHDNEVLFELWNKVGADLRIPVLHRVDFPVKDEIADHLDVEMRKLLRNP